MYILIHLGEDVLQGPCHHRGIPGFGEWGRGSVPTEAQDPITAVHRTGVPGDLPDLHGKKRERELCSYILLFTVYGAYGTVYVSSDFCALFPAVGIQ